MKFAITADVHLKKRDETPERYKALEDILQQSKNNGINYLIIAGDLFDRDFSNYSEFDDLCHKYYPINFLIIPGNHDYQIEQRFFTSSNVEIIKNITIKNIGGVHVLFVPYEMAKSIDESLADYYYREKLHERWILIGHGDYITDNRELNPYEPGFYMPLTTKSIIRYNPLRIFLGHIHKPSDFGRVIYPGSPCGLDITETGRRRFLIYDAGTDSIKTASVQTEKIYFNEVLLLLPFEEENQFLEEKIKRMVEGWQINKEELNTVILRLSLTGYVSDLNETDKTLENLISNYGIAIYDNKIDSSKIKSLKNIESERLYLLNKIRSKIENLNTDKLYVSKNRILEKTMELVFK